MQPFHKHVLSERAMVFISIYNGFFLRFCTFVSITISKWRQRAIERHNVLTLSLPHATFPQTKACADPECFASVWGGGGSTLTTFFFFVIYLFIFFVWWREEGSKNHYYRVINGVSLASRWWPNIECWIGSFVIIRGSGPALLRNPIFM